MRRVLLTALAVAVVIGGCSAASHIGQLQPPKVPKAPAIHVPKTSMQLGIDVDWYAYPGQDVEAQAAETVSYAESLHANALDITFPFFMDGHRPASVHATSATPTPAELNVLITDAQEAGFTVTLRPLMDETSLGSARTWWTPQNIPAFVGAYKKFLTPYVMLAQRDQVAYFVEETELVRFESSPDWTQLTRWVHKVYSGTVMCAANWGVLPSTICGGSADETMDAYHPVKGANLLRGWERWDSNLRHGLVLSEVGIAAAPQAFSKPYVHAWPISAVDPAVQSRWFTAACDAAVHEHLGGIYFWSIGLGTPPAGPTLTDQGSWAGSAGAQAISQCFAAIEGGSL